MKCCCIEPPEPPEPMVNRGMPYCSMKCSLIIIIVSAEITKSQPVPSVFRVPKATAKPKLNGSSESAEVTSLRPDRYPGPQPPPNGKLSLPFHPGPGLFPSLDQGSWMGSVGSSMIEIR